MTPIIVIPEYFYPESSGYVRSPINSFGDDENVMLGNEYAANPKNTLS